jgi:Protein of unknown function (DUF2934)
MPRPSKSQPDTAPTGPRLVKNTAPKTSAQPNVTHEQIATRAYEFFQLEGRAHGNHVDHWLRAESELRAITPPPKRVAATRARG